MKDFIYESPDHGNTVYRRKFSDHPSKRDIITGNEIDTAFDMAIEELAAEKEVTVDYYMMEFM